MSESKTNYKGLFGLCAFLITGSALNMTSGILAYIMITYSEVARTNVALILTIPAAVGAIFAFLSGNLVNRFGARKMTLFCHGTQFLSGMIYLFLGNKTHIAVLYLAAALYGFMLGGFAVIQAQITKDCIPDEQNRGQFLGYATSMRSLGGVAMATVGGMIAAINGGVHWERAYLLYFIMVPCLIIEYFCIPETSGDAAESVKNERKQKSGERLPIKVWLISFHYLLYVLFLYVFSLNISEYVITTHQLGTSTEAGFCLSALTIGGIVSGLLYGWYSRLLKSWTMPALLGISAIALGIIVFVPNMTALYIASGLLGVSLMGTSPYVTIEMGRITTGATYTRAMSVFSGLSNGGMMFAVYILAILSSFFFGDPDSVNGKFMIAFVGNILMVFAAIPLYVSRKRG